MHFKFLNLTAALVIAASAATPSALAAPTPSAAPAHATPAAGRMPFAKKMATMNTRTLARVVGETDPGGTEQARYIVQLADAPLASYRGGVAGFAATSPSITRVGLDRARPAVRAYADYLASRQNTSLDAISQRIGRTPTVRFRYQNAFHGFAVSLTPREAALVAALDGVRMVQREFVSQPQTDRGPAWIGADELWNDSPTAGRGAGVVVGIIDTGINFDSPSFTATASDGYTHTNPRGRYFGVCDANSPVYDASFPCNEKLIGAWDFADFASGGLENDGPADSEDHGSHTASTVAGNPVTAVITAPTTLVQRPISGVAPRAAIIAYDVCYEGGGCPGTALIAAIDQATADGVDVINYSIGSGSRDPWISADAIAMLGAADAGVFVAVSAGNAGPDAATIGSPSNAPWVTSVAASTHDRKFTSALIGLTDGITTMADIAGASIAAGYGPTRIVDAANYASTTTADDGLCLAPFAPGTFNGEIVVCERGENGRVDKGVNVLAGGAGGMILVNNEVSGDSLSADAHALPAIHISYVDGLALRTWISSSAAVTGTIAPFSVTSDVSAGDHMAAFSSRGPDATTAGVIKPDIAAPGVDIIAATHDGNQYMSMSGTSMASPHIAGAAALLTALHPDWTPSEIRSALMLTSLDVMLKEDGATPTDPFDSGAGRARVDFANDTLLVLDEQSSNFAAANPSYGGDPSTLNLASLMQQNCVATCTWTRTFRNQSAVAVGAWTISSTAPASVTLSASPASFTLTAGSTQVVTFTADVSATALDTWIFGTFVLTGDVPAHLPVAVQAKEGAANYDADGIINITTHRDAGSYRIDGLRSQPTDALTAAVYDGSSTNTSESITADPTNTDVFDDLSQVFTRMVTIDPAKTKLLAVQLADSTAPDLDLYIGRDLNDDGLPSSDEIECASTTFAAAESCTIVAPTMNHWIVVQNWQPSAAAADTFNLKVITVTTATPSTKLSASLPAAVTSNDSFSIDLTWNLPNLAAGDSHYAMLELSTSPTSSTPFLSRPVVIYRDSDHISFAANSPTLGEGYLLPGQQVSFTTTLAPANDAPAGTIYRITATLPNEMDYVPASAQLRYRGAAMNVQPVVDGRTLAWSIDTLPSAPHYVMSTNDPSRPEYSAACSSIGSYDSLGAYGIPALAGVDGDGRQWNVETLWNFGTGQLAPATTSYQIFGRAHPQYYLTDDGLLTYGYADTALHSGSPQAIPSAATPNALVAPFWADMEIVHDPASGRGVRILSAEPGSLVEYDGVQIKNDPSTQIDMQVLTFRAAVDGIPEIIFFYGDISGTLPSGVVGIESEDGTDGVAFTGTLKSGLNICFDWTVDTIDLSFNSQVRNDVLLDAMITATLLSKLDVIGTREQTSTLAMFVSGVVLETAVTSPERVLPGQPVTYTIFVTNTGSVTATNVSVEATVPLGAAYLSGGTHEGGIVSFTIASIASGASASRQFSVMPTFDAAARPSPSRPAIISGTVAAEGAWPWQASLVLNSASSTQAGHNCGGSLISRDFVLTAAHCTSGRTAAELRVMLGRNTLSAAGGQEIQVAEIIQHPDYDPTTYDNDIALLRLESPATLNDRVQTIDIATTGHAGKFAAGVLATVTGWGDIDPSSAAVYPDSLYQVQVPIVEQATCVANYAVNNSVVTDNMLCAGVPEGGIDSCQGDSGGPLVARNGSNWLLAGVVSWGNGCALPNFPGVYARVASFTDYVHDMQRSLGPVYVNVSDATGLAGHAGSTFTINRTVARPLLDLLFPLSRL